MQDIVTVRHQESLRIFRDTIFRLISSVELLRITLVKFTYPKARLSNYSLLQKVNAFIKVLTESSLTRT